MKGYIQAALYILVISISTVWVSHLGNSISVSLLLLGVSLVAMIFFNAMRLKYFMRNHATIVKTPILWLAMSVSMLLVWWLSYYSAIHSSASFALALLFLWQALSAAIFEKRWFSVAVSILIWIGIYFLAPKATPITFVTSTLSGMLAYVYYRTSYSYAHKHSMIAVDILAVRFYPIFLFSLFYVMIDTSQHITLYQGGDFLYVALLLLALGFLNMILPNFCSQSSVQNIGAEKFSFISTWIPVLTFLLQGMFLGTWSMSLLIACFLTSLVLNMKSISHFLLRSNKSQ